MKKILITMGEPGGIGPEIIVKSIASDKVRNTCKVIVIGNIEVIKKALRLTGIRLNIKRLSSPSEYRDGAIGVIDTGDVVTVKSSPSSDSGKAVVAYIKTAVRLALKGGADAIVTAPISKESLNMAGYPWQGHTEMLAEFTDTEDYAMMFVGRRLKVILATVHVPFVKVPSLINEGLIMKTITLAKRGADMLGIKKPRIAVAGLNPHAGESGLLGREEIDILLPAIENARAKGLDVSGPYPPDVIFYKAYKGDFDMIVAMYHDQALVPFKMLNFEKGVNVTVGLPIIRTSPDHGTAFDIAWKNIANPSSMIEAIRQATKLRRA